MHGCLDNARTGSLALVGVGGVGAGIGGVGMKSYQKGRMDERKAIRKKVGKMLDQVKKLEIYQSSQVTLQELGIWMDERTDGVTKKFVLAAAEALQAERIKQGLMRM